MKQQQTKNRVDWIDYGKGICMIFVVLYHTQVYYANQSEASFIYTPFFLTLFFFISGFLSYSPKKLDIRKKLTSITRSLLLPYFIFTTIIWLPKAIYYDNKLNFMSYFDNVFGGYASWFVAALVIVKLLFLLIRIISNSLILFWIFTMSSFVMGVILSHIIETPSPWFLISGMIALLYFMFGYTMARYKILFEKLHSKISFIFSCLVYIFLILANCKYLEFYKNIFPDMASMSIVTILAYLIMSLFGIVLMINIVYRLPKGISIIKKIGVNSLIFYFLNGGIITTFCIVNKKINIIPYGGNFYEVIIFTAVVVMSLYIISNFIMKYIPIIVGDKEAVNKLILKLLK